MKTAKERRFDKILSIASGALVGLVALVIGLTFIWALYGPSHPIVISSVHVENGQVAGGDLVYTVHACKKADLPSTLYRDLIGVGTNFNYAYPQAHGVVKPGCHVTNVSLPLPSNILPGRYYLRDDAAYQVNPIRVVNVYSQSNIFTVVAK